MNNFSIFYPYITSNNLYDKQNYMYSKYYGIDFLRAYVQSRKLNDYLGDKTAATLENEETSATYQELKRIYRYLHSDGNHEEALEALKGYVKSFEVRKRIYTAYENWNPIDSASYEEYGNYLCFADNLIQAYILTRNLKYFSCLLKLDDTLLSLQSKLNPSQKGHLKQITAKELGFFSQLLEAKGICLEELQ